MNLIIAIVLAVLTTLLVVVLGAVLLITLTSDSVRRKEMANIQGGWRSIVRGKLENTPSDQGLDFAIINGLEFESGQYVRQSRISVEALKSVFFS